MDTVVSAARVLIACAVLLGLVFMHSLSAPVPAIAQGHDAMMADTGTTMPRSELLASALHSMGHSSVCESTPPRGHLTARLAQAATGPVEPALSGQPTPAIRWAGGAVPRAGPALLVGLCVSRT